MQDLLQSLKSLIFNDKAKISNELLNYIIANLDHNTNNIDDNGNLACQNCINCHNCIMCVDCENCHDCIGCYDVRNSEAAILSFDSDRLFMCDNLLDCLNCKKCSQSCDLINCENVHNKINLNDLHKNEKMTNKYHLFNFVYIENPVLSEYDNEIFSKL